MIVVPHFQKKFFFLSRQIASFRQTFQKIFDMKPCFIVPEEHNWKLIIVSHQTHYMGTTRHTIEHSI